jgi:hypothetical protein
MKKKEERKKDGEERKESDSDTNYYFLALTSFSESCDFTSLCTKAMKKVIANSKTLKKPAIYRFRNRLTVSNSLLLTEML